MAGLPAGVSGHKLKPDKEAVAVGATDGELTWAHVHTFPGHSDVKASCVGEGHIYTSSRSGLKKWDPATGAGGSELFVADTGLVHALCAVGDALWACFGDGKIAIYNTLDGSVKLKAFVGHQGEILCCLAGPGGRYVITGGVDFQAKTWSLSGEPLATSSHHHGALDCLLVTPLKAGGMLWTGSADGMVFAWPDNEASGLIDETNGVMHKVEGGRGVKSLAHSGKYVWAGCDDGRLCVLRADSGRAFKSLKPHTGSVVAMAAVGDQIWTGGADKLLLAHDAVTCTTVCQLGNQGGFLRSLLPTGGWTVWAFTSKDARVFTAESIWAAEADKTAEAHKQLSSLQASSAAELAAVKLRADGSAIRVKELEVQVKNLSAQAAAAKQEGGKGADAAAEAAGQVAALQAQQAGHDEECAELRASMEEAEAALRKEALAHEATTVELAAIKERSRGDAESAAATEAGLIAAKQELQQQLDEATTELTQLRSGPDQAAELVAALAQVQQLQTQLEEQRGAAEELRLQMAAAQEAQATGEVELEALREQVAALQAALDAARAGHDALAAEHTSTLEALREEHAAAVEAASADAAAEAEQASLAAEAQVKAAGNVAADRSLQLNAEKAALQAEKAQLAAEKAALVVEKAAVERKLADLERLHSALNLRHTQSGTALKAAEEAGAAAAAAKATADLAAAASADRAAKLSAEKSVLLTEKAQLAAEKAVLTANKAAADRKYGDLDRLHSTLAARLAQSQLAHRTAEEECQQARDSLGTTKADLDAAKALSKALDDEKARLDQQHKTLKVQHERMASMLATEKGKSAELEGRLQRTEQQARSFQEQLQQHQDQADKAAAVAESRLQDAQRELQDTRRQRDQLAAQAGLERELDKLKGRIDGVEAQMGSRALVPAPMAGAMMSSLPSPPHGMVMPNIIINTGSPPPAMAGGGGLPDQERALWQTQLQEFSARNRALEESAAKFNAHISELRTALEASEAAGEETQRSMEAALQAVHGELNQVLEDRYQLQVSLRAAQKAQATAEAAAAAAASAARAVAGIASTAPAPPLQPPPPPSTMPVQQAPPPPAAPSAPPAHVIDPGTMQQLEGALRQATSDYQMLLTEMGKIKSEAAVRERALGEAQSERSHAEKELAVARAEVDRLFAILKMTQEQLASMPELTHQIMDLMKRLDAAQSCTRRFEDLEQTHVNIQSRIAEAAAAPSPPPSFWSPPPTMPYPPLLPMESSGGGRSFRNSLNAAASLTQAAAAAAAAAAAVSRPMSPHPLSPPRPSSPPAASPPLPPPPAAIAKERHLPVGGF